MKKVLVWLVMILFALGVVFYQGAQLVIDQQLQRLSDHGQAAVKGATKTITKHIIGQYQVGQILARYHAEDLEALFLLGLDVPNEPYHQLSQTLLNRFSEVLGDIQQFSVLDLEQGRVVGSDSFRMGSLCQTQLNRSFRWADEQAQTGTMSSSQHAFADIWLQWSTNNQLPDSSPLSFISLHGNPQFGYHYDVITDFSAEFGDAMGLMVSYPFTQLQQILASFSSEDVDVLLVNRQQPHQIELSALGVKDSQFGSQFTPSQFAGVIQQSSLGVSQWDVLAVPGLSVVEDITQSVQWFAWQAYLVVVLTAIVFAFFYRGVDRDRQWLNKKNQRDDLFNYGSTVLVIRQADSPYAVQYVSPNIQTQLGIAEATWLDVRNGTPTYMKRLHPEDEETYVKALAQLNLDHHQVTCEYRLRDGDEQYRWISEFIEYTAEDDEPVLRSYLQDINRIKSASHTQQQLIEAAPDAILVTDAKGRILQVNSALEQLFDYDRTDVIGQTVEMFLPEAMRDSHVLLRDQYMANSQRRGLMLDRLFYGENSKGERIPLEIELNPMTTDQGKWMYCTIRDMRSRLAYQQALVDAKRQAEAAMQARSQFLANMSHEIRTPMNSVMGIAELLAMTELTKEQQDYVTIITQSSQSLLTIINDILDFSKLESGKFELVAVPFDLSDLLRSVVDLLAIQAKKKSLRLSYELTPALPDALVGDAVRLRQVLLNLLGNALKFTSQGQVHLAVSWQPEGDRQVKLHVVVSDTGIGIASDQLDKLFQSFSQVDDSSARHFGGTGLGLVISQQLVHLMGGHITVESVLGEGSCFAFDIVLPCQCKSISADMPVEKTHAQLHGHVLLVEDNVINQKVALAMLDKLGVTCDVVTDGEQGVEKYQAESRRYDLILMDCQMPVMDGYEATRLVRQWEKQTSLSPVPIIALTANVLPEEKQKCFAVGMDDFLPKPMQLQATRTLLSKWLTGADSTSSHDVF